MRIAKYIAGAGICSRREAEKLIEQGFVTLNGKVLETPAIKITENDVVCVKGEEVKQTNSSARLFMINKPKDYLCTNKDPQGRNVIFDIIPKNLPRLVLVGRLDFNTEGLLLLSTDSSLATKMMHPKNALKRVYKVRINGKLHKENIEQLKRGITVEGVRYKGVEVENIQSKEGRNSWVKLTLTEGKNREIKKLMEHFGLKVSRLIRLSYGPFELGRLPSGEIVEIPYNKVKKLSESLI